MKIERENLSDKVEEKLKELLLQGKWQEGEKIPPETELAQLFGVSRLTVRLALQKLNVLGLLETRVGDGTYVKKFSMRNYMDTAFDFYVTPELMQSVCEYRKIIEIEAARLAIERATPEDIQKIQDCVDKHLENSRTIPEDIQPTDKEFLRFVESDLEIHEAICEAAHNELLTLSMETFRKVILKYLVEIIAQRVETVGLLYYQKNGKTEVHQLILDEIKATNFDKCKQLYEAMIDYKVDRQEYFRLTGSEEAAE